MKWYHIPIYFLIIFLAFFCIIFFFCGRADKISYLAKFEDGRIMKVDSIVVVPISSAEDVNRIWPEYYAEIMLVNKIKLCLGPFIFCENPAIEGKHGDRTVYYIEEKK